jgi:phospholipid transport system substrate-binding protein
VKQGEIVRKTSKYLTVFLFLYFLAIPHWVFAGEPTTQLSTTINEFLKILINTSVAELQATGLPENARKLIFARFDFSEMTQLSLGTHWKSLNGAEQKEFVDAFTQRLLINYGRNMRSTGDEKIQYQDEVQNGKQATVDTKVVSGNGDELPIEYRLHDVDGQWKVYDVAIDSVSVVKNFREQFQRVIAKTSIQELLKKLKEQNS